LCNSAGNEGSSSWYYLTAPADAFDILSVGAVDSTNVIANFSSRGPSFDARVKPEVVAMGRASGVQGLHGGLARSNGTSFSSPILAGSVASLWQAYPALSAKELIRWVRLNGDRSKNPDSTYGFGLPDFGKIYWNITDVPTRLVPGQMEVYPNPAVDHLMIKLPEATSGLYTVQFHDMSGRMIHSEQVTIPGEVVLSDRMKDGLYILEIKTVSGIYHTAYN